MQRTTIIYKNKFLYFILMKNIQNVWAGYNVGRSRSWSTGLGGILGSAAGYQVNRL